jgi:thiamine-phosphate pyrophosphorylase
MHLHVITDDAGAGIAALDAGAPVVQVRARGVTDRALHDLAALLCSAAHERGALCIVDDRVDVALAVGADGVHVGADDLPVAAVRRLLGPDAVVGASARTVASARAAVADGASYLGVGPCYATDSKPGLPEPIGTDRLAEVAAAVEVPVVAIGGVTAAAVGQLLAAGARGVAVIGAVTRAADPAAATRELLDALAAVQR